LVKGKKNGSMEQNMRENIKAVRKMVLEYIVGKMEHIMKVTGKMIFNKDMANIFGQTGEFMMETGFKGRCTVKVYINGQKAECMKETFSMI